MFSKMLKLTTVLLVLMAFFVVPVIVLSDGTNNGGGTPEVNMKCKGEFDATLKLVTLCIAIPIDECAGSSSKYTVTSESEGCLTPAYGWVCTEKKAIVPITTSPCEIKEVKTIGEEETMKMCWANTANSTTSDEKFDDCSHVDMSQ